MVKQVTRSAFQPLGGQCECGRRAFPIAISDISCEGCWVEGAGEWEEAYEFLHLTIDERIEINGKVTSLDGCRAWVHFFGELHPAVVKGLAGVA